VWVEASAAPSRQLPGTILTRTHDRSTRSRPEAPVFWTPAALASGGRPCPLPESVHPGIIDLFCSHLKTIEKRIRDSASAATAEESFLEIKQAVVVMRRTLMLVRKAGPSWFGTASIQLLIIRHDWPQLE
jgi:hypothetical protein